MGADLVSGVVGDPVLGWFPHHAASPVVWFHAVLENHRLIAIDRGSVFLVFLQASEVPVRGHGDVVPGRNIEGGFEKLLGAEVRMFHPYFMEKQLILQDVNHLTINVTAWKSF